MGQELRFEQDPLEDRAWDQALLGDAYAVFLGALHQTETSARPLGTLRATLATTQCCSIESPQYARLRPPAELGT